MPTPNIVEIDSITGFAGISYSDFGPNQDLGPWYISSKRYIGYMRSLPQTHPSPDLLYTAVASSADGITFTCHDQANAPGLRSLNLGPTGAVCLGNDGTTLYTAYADLSNNISIIPFDTGTDLYGAILSGGPAVTSHVMISSLRMLSTGVLVVVYGVDTGAFGALQIVTCTTGGVWGSPVTIVTDVNPVNNFCMSNVPDSAGNAHILAMAWNGSTNAVSLDYYIVNGASVTGPTSILTGGTNTLLPYANTCGTGYYDATNDRVLFPYLYDTGGVGGVGIIRVDAASTSPVATIDNVGAMYDSNYGYPGITADPGNTTYIFTYQNFTTTEQLFRWTRPANTHISWAMTVWWNYNTDPPTPDPSSPGDPAIEENPPSGLRPLGTGGFGTLVSFFGGGGSSTMQYCNTLYYMEAAGPSLRLIKSVSGGTALPTQWLLRAIGPVTVSGAGDTGVVEVTAGAYALTESPGADGYIASDWVCTGGTQSGSSVTIGANDTVVCTITNTAAAVPFKATCPSPIIILGVPYSSFVTVTGGTPPYTFAVHSGSLPTGLSLNASTGEISGTPSAAGPFTFTIRVTDSLGATADTPNCPAGRCTGTVSII